MSKHVAGSSSASTLPPAKRRAIIADLAAASGTQVGAARLLQRLRDHGLLVKSAFEGCSERTLRGDASRGTSDAVANVITPFGAVVQSMNVHGTNLDVVNPFAFLHHMCTQQFAFFRLLFPDEQGVHRKVVLYVDEVRPGNPLRHDKGRTTQCIYWTFADFPERFLCDANAWFCVATIRSSLVEAIPGKISAVMAAVTKMFFTGTPNFGDGILMHSGNCAAVMTASFAGYLGDEKALKEIFSLKGAAGTRPCPTCANVVQFLEVEPGSGLVGIHCCDPESFVTVTDDQFYEMADTLAAYTGPRAGMVRLERSLGITYDPYALIFDAALRHVVLPVTHYIRDWMHVIAGHGVGGTHLAVLFQELTRNRITYDMIQQYVIAYTLPKAHGAVKPVLFSSKHVDDDHLRVFASEFLTMVPLMQAFMHDVVQPLGIMADHIACLDHLGAILDVLQSGPVSASRRRDELSRLVNQHHATFVALYGPGACKPKFHHMMHLHDHSARLGCIISCFVTERKHKVVKSTGTWSFNKYEHTVTRSVLFKQLQALSDTAFYDEASVLNGDKTSADGVELVRATAARLACGEIRRADIVVCQDRSVVEIIGFLKLSGVPVVMAYGIRLVPTHVPTEWSRTGAAEHVFDASHIVKPMVFAPRNRDVIRILRPPR